MALVPRLMFSQSGISVTRGGELIDGVWYCDCEPRLSAAHYQTKKPGINQGRWFYTCNKWRPESCGFFLWEDEIEGQAGSAKSTLEPHTPRKNASTQIGGLPTPSTSSTPSTPRTSASRFRKSWNTLTTPSKVRNKVPDDLDTMYEDLWDTCDDENGEPIWIPPSISFPSTRNKTPSTGTNAFSGKRKFDDFNDDQPSSATAPNSSSQSSVTITTTTTPLSSVEVSITPGPRRHGDVPSTQESSSSYKFDIASHVLGILDRHKVVVPRAAKDEVSHFLSQQPLETHVIVHNGDK